MKTPALNLIIIIFIILFFSGCKLKKQDPAEETFLGEWYAVKGDMEAYSFLKDSNNYIFIGTQDMRPVVYGSWKIDKNKFIITTDNGTLTSYAFVLSNDTLTFNQGERIYTRIAPLEARHTEVRVLVKISSEFSSSKFSEPQPADLNWDFHADNTQSPQRFSLKGYSISAVTTLTSDVITEITNYLKDYGFEQDTISVSLTCNGFRDDNQIVTICTNKKPGAKSDSIFIQITSGLIVK